MKYKYKHPLKVHVWGGISKRGATHIVIFSGIMTATRYADILSASLLPFIRKYFEGVIVFSSETKERKQLLRSSWEGGSRFSIVACYQESVYERLPDLPI